jgi:hypothetical protein
MKYEVYEFSSVVEMETVISLQLERGWSLVGGISCFRDDTGVLWYVQAMTSR